MTNEQHDIERRQDDDRWRWAFGILVTIGLFTGAQLIGGLIWGGMMTANLSRAQTDIGDTADQLEEALTRVGALEASRASTASEVTALRRDLTEFRQEQREENQRQRQDTQRIVEYLQRIYQNGSPAQ